MDEGTTMIRTTAAVALLATSALFPQTSVLAQEPSAATTSDTQAQIEALQGQVKALQETLEQLKAQVATTTPVWKGAPQLANEEAGWSFKPRGRLQYDFGRVSSGGYDNLGLGFSNEIRRARLGVEGTMPGDFGYKFEVDAASGSIEFADAYFSYAPGPLEVIVGQQNNFQSLEELTSSLHTSFIERAAFTDAFGFERRVGVSAQYARGNLLAQGGVFTDSIADLNDLGDRNNSYGFDSRLVYAPKFGGSQLHFAGSVHWRDLNDAASIVRYRQRPAIHTTDVRFIDTGRIDDAKTETGYGVEAAGIFGPFYVAGEAYWQTVSRSGDDPTFFGAYLEGGYFLTGESRGYKAGKFDRVKVNKPFGKGGTGAFSLNARWDHLDLIDSGFVGGTQNAYQASLNWKPTDYVLFGLNYAHIIYDDAAIAPSGDGDYSVDVTGLRSQIDF
jgi:phosphate-selective porin OprO/OprP